MKRVSGIIVSRRMKADNRVIILKGKDCTDRIRSIRMLPSGKYEVFFIGDRRKFAYLPSNVQILAKKESISTEGLLPLVDGQVQNGVVRIDNYGSFNKLIYKTGFEKLVEKSSLKLVNSCLDDVESKVKFEYLKSIASVVSLHTDEGKNILGSYYEKAGFIREDTVLASYLAGEISDNRQYELRQNIFPFGFNASQKKATENALNHRLSVIQGPPGTSKTQTILNLIANIVKEGKTVAIVSNNNSATDNIYEKLQSSGVDFIAARLGSIKNKQDFTQNQYMPPEERLQTWRLTRLREQEIETQITDLDQEVDNALEKKNQLAFLKDELDSVATELKHFTAYYEKSHKSARIPTFWKKIRSENLLELWYRVDSKSGTLTFRDKLWSFLICGVKPDGFYEQPLPGVVATLQITYYQAKINELEGAVERIEDYLSGNDINEKINRHTDLSMQLFRSRISKRYSDNPKRLDYSLDDLWKSSGEFIKDYPAVLSTTYSLRNSLSYNYVYDYVIVDEASQVDLATFALALSCAKNAVVVGDEKQLPNVVDRETKRKDNDIFGQFSIPDSYMFSKHSALSSVTDLFGDVVPSQLLREHYRCHPKIIGFCNKMFYDNELIILTPEVEDSRDPIKVYETVEGNHAREDHINQRQIDVTLQEVVPNEQLNLFDGSVGIVTPYRNQARALNEALVGKRVLAATVDKFQGREREVIIINTVDNKISDFASNPNRLNVAVSRAQKQLIIVTNGNHNSSQTGIGELIEYIRYNNYKVTDSDVRSIFDNLYSSYYRYRAKKARQGSSPAEDLMFELLNRVYKEHGFTNLDTQLEYPLKLLVNTENLHGREREYADHDWTRVDFVVFRKTSKQPLLAIEVDGYAFHGADNTKAGAQRERDRIKSKLLEEAGVPLLRLRTTGSGEEELIVGRLRGLMEA